MRLNKSLLLGWRCTLASLCVCGLGIALFLLDFPLDVLFGGADAGPVNDNVIDLLLITSPLADLRKDIGFSLPEEC